MLIKMLLKKKRGGKDKEEVFVKIQKGFFQGGRSQRLGREEPNS
jgi:hypothetical protein